MIKIPIISISIQKARGFDYSLYGSETYYFVDFCLIVDEVVTKVYSIRICLSKIGKYYSLYHKVITNVWHMCDILRDCLP